VKEKNQKDIGHEMKREEMKKRGKECHEETLFSRIG
jgi:hypothetical protein